MKDPSGEMKRAVEQVGDRGGASAGGKKRISIPFASHSEQPDAGSVNATATPMDSPAASSDRTQPLIVHGVTIPVKPKPPGEEGENPEYSISDCGMGLPSYLAGTLTGCRAISCFHTACLTRPSPLAQLIATECCMSGCVVSIAPPGRRTCSDASDR